MEHYAEVETYLRYRSLSYIASNIHEAIYEQGSENLGVMRCLFCLYTHTKNDNFEVCDGCSWGEVFLCCENLDSEWSDLFSRLGDIVIYFDDAELAYLCGPHVREIMKYVEPLDFKKYFKDYPEMPIPETELGLWQAAKERYGRLLELSYEFYLACLPEGNVSLGVLPGAVVDYEIITLLINVINKLVSINKKIDEKINELS